MCKKYLYIYLFKFFAVSFTFLYFGSTYFSVLTEPGCLLTDLYFTSYSKSFVIYC